MASKAKQVLVIALASVLAVTALANVHRQANANATACLTNLKQVGLATLMYTQDYDEVLPYTSKQAKFQEAIWPYLKNRTVLSCPESKAGYKFNSSLYDKKNGKKLGYPLKKVQAPAGVVSAYDPKGHSDGTWGAVFVDGHAKRFPKLPSLAVK